MRCLQLIGAPNVTDEAPAVLLPVRSLKLRCLK
jgi:hypothetical protein